MTPRMEAIAFRIWQVAEPKGWDISVQDIAATTGINARLVGRVAKAKSWNTRLRASARDCDLTLSWFSVADGGVVAEFDR